MIIFGNQKPFFLNITFCIDNIQMRTSRILNQQVKALLEVDVGVVCLLTTKPQAGFVKQCGEVVALEWELFRLFEAEL